MDRHLPPLRVAVEVAVALVGELLEREAAPRERALLAVLREDHVARVERARRADRDALLARAREVEREAPLALRHEEELVHLLHAHHHLVHFAALGRADPRLARAAHELARLRA